jgi:hypothetical protein
LDEGGRHLLSRHCHEQETGAPETTSDRKLEDLRKLRTKSNSKSASIGKPHPGRRLLAKGEAIHCLLFKGPTDNAAPQAKDA